MDVLLSWLEQRDNYKRYRQTIQDAFNSQDQHEEDISAMDGVNLRKQVKVSIKVISI